MRAGSFFIRIKLLMLKFTLYSRSYCHLCEDMALALKALLGDLPYELEITDVDADPALVEKYDELVPVLTGYSVSNGWQQLCHYHLDAKAVTAFLQEQS